MALLHQKMNQKLRLRVLTNKSGKCSKSKNFQLSENGQ